MSTLDVFEEVDEFFTHKRVKFSTPISKYENANQFCYCYDMNFRITIYFRIIKKYENIFIEKKNTNNRKKNIKEKNTEVELIYQNELPKLKCSNHKICKNMAINILKCSLLCAECSNDVDEPEFLFNIFNSPINLICCYGE